MTDSEGQEELKASYFHQSAIINEFTAALAKAQILIEPPKKNRTVKVSGTSKAGKAFEYTFKYADLEECKRVSQKALSENGLSFASQNIIWKNKPWLWSRLFHSSGQWIGSLYLLPDTDEPKEFAAEITYGRRYQYCELIDLAAEDDNDAPPERSYVKDAYNKNQQASVPPKPLAPPKTVASGLSTTNPIQNMAPKKEELTDALDRLKKEHPPKPGPRMNFPYKDDAPFPDDQ